MDGAMSKVMLLTVRRRDGMALRDLLVDEGHDVELADDAQLVTSGGAGADVIVADLEPWTWAGKVLVDHVLRVSGGPRLVLLCTRIPRGPLAAGVTLLHKPVALDELRGAIAGAAAGRVEEAA
jgi:hypothetical protein